jgi:nucleotide-binding universal stress UspA family protein
VVFLFEKVLITTDNVDIIDNALIYIDAMFPKAKLHVISIHDKSQITTEQLDNVFNRLSQEGAEETANLTEMKLKQLKMKAKVKVLEGKPGKEIAAYVKKNGIDIIIAETYDKYGLQTKKLEPLLEELARQVNVPLLAMNTPDNLRKPKRVLVVTDETEKITNVNRLLNYLYSSYKCSFTFMVPRADAKGVKTKLTKPILDMGLSLKTKRARVGTLTNLTTLANAAIEHSQTHDIVVFSHHERKMADLFSNSLKQVFLKSKVPVIVVYPHHKIKNN